MTSKQLRVLCISIGGHTYAAKWETWSQYHAVVQTIIDWAQDPDVPLTRRGAETLFETAESMEIHSHV